MRCSSRRPVESKMQSSTPPANSENSAVLATDAEGQPERECETQRNRREDDEEAFANDVAQAELIERDEQHEHDHGVHGGTTEELAVGDTHVATVNSDRASDEAAEVGA